MVFQDAIEAAQTVLDEFVRPGSESEIVLASCTEFDLGWAFSYNSRAFLETQDLAGSLIGNGQIVVPRNGEAPYFAPPDFVIAEPYDRPHGFG